MVNIQTRTPSSDKNSILSLTSLLSSRRSLNVLANRTSCWDCANLWLLQHDGKWNEFYYSPVFRFSTMSTTALGGTCAFLLNSWAKMDFSNLYILLFNCSFANSFRSSVLFPVESNTFHLIIFIQFHLFLVVILCYKHQNLLVLDDALCMFWQIY